jgi:predicted DCC family thiol-disulfide oxidoreductase YuxK
VTVRSRAVARVLRALPLPFHALRIIALPGLRHVADRVYDLVAAHRHRISSWMGLDRCAVRGLPRGAGRGERAEPRSTAQAPGRLGDAHDDGAP